MKKLIIPILFFLSATTIVAQTVPVFEAIRMHRDWMKANTPDPATLGDQELMHRAAEIISYRLAEPEAERVLEAAANKVPEVREYKNWQALAVPDTLMQRQRNAIGAICGYLERSRAESFEERRLRAKWLDTEVMFRNILPEYDALIEKQHEIVRTVGGKQEKSLLLEMKAGRLKARLYHGYIDDHGMYNDIYDLEREILDLYPAKSSEFSSEKITLYANLAYLKQVPQNESYTDMTSADTGTDTRYDYINRGFECNSGFYYEKVRDMCVILYGTYHPITSSAQYSLINYQINNFSVTPERIDTARTLSALLSAYYPEKSIESKLSRLLVLEAKYKFDGKSALESGDISDISRTAFITYGSGNPCCGNIVLSLMYQSLVDEKRNFIKGDAEINEMLNDIEPGNSADLQPELLSLIGQYYWKTGRREDGIAFYEGALDSYSRRHEAKDGGYYDIVRMLANLYFDVGDVNSRTRLAARIRKDISHEVNCQLSVELGYYLMDELYRALNNKDYYALIYYFVEIFKVKSELSSNVVDSNELRFTFEVDCASIATSVIAFLIEDVKKAQLQHDPSDPQQVKDFQDRYLSIEPILQLADGVKTQMIDTELGFPDYDPEYLNNNHYNNLLSSLAEYYHKIDNDYVKAQEYYNKAIEASVLPVVKRSMYNQLAQLATAQGDSVAADSYLLKSIEMIECNPDSFGEDHNILALAYRYNKYFAADELELAEQYARKIYRRLRSHIDGSLQFMSTQDQEQFFCKYGDPARVFTRLLEKSPEKLAGEVYNAVLYRTGIKLRTGQETRLLIEKSENPVVRILADSLESLRKEYRQLLQYDDTDNQYLRCQRVMQNGEMSFRIQSLELQLLDLIAPERSAALQDVRWQEIRDTLAPGEAAIEFIFSASRIMALVIRPGVEAPVPVILAPWSVLFENIKKLKGRNSAALAKRIYGEKSQLDLYALLWEPLEHELNGVTKIFFNAPGLLHTIAFHAISTPAGKYLTDCYDLRQVTTTAQLTLQFSEGAPRTATVIGDILFDPSQAAQADKTPELTGERAVCDDFAIDDFTSSESSCFDSRGVSRQYFPYLPFTGAEINEIEEIFGSKAVRITRRGLATEKCFRTICQTGAPEVLHLATHGFFITDESAAMKVPFMRRYASHVGSPMQRSGIALADAEASWRGQEVPEDSDGILTAGEVARLNLKGTRLVALSACESALGGYDFEGVHGLTRGFKQAGVRSLLVSLWSVNDRSTALFMSEFYRHWISSGDRHEAYRHAVKSVREKYPAPFYWAPFILLD